MNGLHKAETAVNAVWEDLFDDLAEYRCDSPVSPELYDATRKQTELLGVIMGMLKVAQTQQRALVDMSIAENRSPPSARNERYNGIISWKNL